MIWDRKNGNVIKKGNASLKKFFIPIPSPKRVPAERKGRIMGKKKKEELPDYTVAKMDVDGMPWNSRRPWQILPGDPSKHRKEFDVKVPEPGMESDMPDNLSAFENPPMTKEERRGMIWLSLKASLTVGLIFGGAAFLFILFCVFVWLK